MVALQTFSSRSGMTSVSTEMRWWAASVRRLPCLASL